MNTRLKIYQRMTNMMVILALSFLQVVPTAHAIGEYDYMNQDNLNEEAITEEVLDENPLLSEEVGEILQDDEINHVIDTHTHKTTIKKDSDMMDLSADEEVVDAAEEFGELLVSNYMSDTELEEIDKNKENSTFDTKVKSNLTNSNEAMITNTMSTTSTYKMATDADFSGSRDGNFKYIGTDEYVIIPHVIQGINITSYDNMFSGTSVKGVVSTNKNVTRMSGMFASTKATSLDLSNFDTSSVTLMSSMFERSQATSLDLSNFDTSNVTNMGHMFYESQTTSLNLSSFDTSSVTSMSGMFNGSQAPSIDLSSFDTSRVTSMFQMFAYSRATSLDLSSFDTSILRNVNSMFQSSQATTGYAWTQADADKFNGSSSKPSRLTFIVKDKDAPTVSFGTNGNSAASQSHSTTVNVTDTQSGVATSQYQWSTSTSTPTGTWTNFSSGQTITRSSGTGNYYLHIRATDNQGNVRNSRTNAFNMDNTPPTTPTLTSSTTAWTNGNVTVTGTYPSDATVRQYRIGSGAWTNYTAPFAVTANATIQARARDSAGNWSSTRSLTFSNIDKELPNGTISASTTAHTRGNVTLTFNATDTGGSGVRRVRVSGGSWVNGSTTTQVASSNGTYSFEVEDNAGNTRTVSRSVSNIDKTSPSVNLSKNGGGYAKTHSTAITVTDSLSGVNTIQYRWTTNTTFPTSGLTTVTSGTSVSAPTTEGNHYLHVRATDKVGNVRNFTSNVFRVDLTAPTHVSNTVTGQRYTSGTNYWVRPNDVVTVNFRQRDTLSGNQRGYIRLTGNSQDVRYYHLFTGTATNMTPVNASFVNTTSIGVQSVNRTEHSTSTGYGTAQWKVKLNTTGHNYELQYYYSDNASNVRGYITVGRLRVDGTAPTVTLTPNTTGHTNQNVTITATASDVGSGVKRIQRPDGTWANGSTTTHAVSSNGTYSFVVEDNVGNQRTQTISVSNIDKTLPNGTITGNPTSWRNSNATLTFNATDTGGSGVRRVRIKGGTWVNGATTTQVATQNGTYAFEVEDNAGNTREVSVVVNRIDKTAPTSGITQTPTAWTNQPVRLLIQGSDTQSGIQKIEHVNQSEVKTKENLLTDGNVSKSTSEYMVSQYNLNEPLEAGKTYTMTIKGTKKSSQNFGLWQNGASTGRGNLTHLGNDIYELTFTAASPISGRSAIENSRVRIYQPSSGTRGPATIEWARLVKHDSNPKTGMHHAVADYEVAQNGTYTFRITDNVGNHRDQSITVSNIDTIKPNGTITGNPTSWTNSNQTLTFKATDTGGSGVRRVRVKDGSWVNGSTATLAVSSNGTYVFTVEDNAGNTRDVSVTVNRIDKTLPTVSFGTNGSSTPRQSHSTTVSVADSQSGVATRQYQWSTGTTTPTGTWTNFSNGQTITRSSGTGNYYLHIRATDSAGNVRNSRTNAFNLDNTAPTTPTLTASTTAWTKGNVTVTGTYPSDATVKQYRIGSGSWQNYSSAVTMSSNGTVQARAQDSAGNWSAVGSINVTNIDKTKPSITVTGNPSQQTSQDVTLTISASDDESGIQSIRLPNNQIINGNTATFIVAENGSYTFIATDKAGNELHHTEIVKNIQKEVPLVMKVTSAQGVGLQGAVFELYKDDVLLKTATSQPNGSVNFGNVAIVGDYHILQTVVPEGYRLMRDKILIETEGTNPTIINYKESEMMPGTGTTELLPYISIIVIAGAFTSFIETKKRNKR